MSVVDEIESGQSDVVDITSYIRFTYFAALKTMLTCIKRQGVNVRFR